MNESSNFKKLWLGVCGYGQIAAMVANPTVAQWVITTGPEWVRAGSSTGVVISFGILFVLQGLRLWSFVGSVVDR